MVQLLSCLEPAHPGCFALLICAVLQAHTPTFEGVLCEGMP